jgi:hypothetical protein
MAQSLPPLAPAVSWSARATWLVAPDGGIFSCSGAKFDGSTESQWRRLRADRQLSDRQLSDRLANHRVGRGHAQPERRRGSGRLRGISTTRPERLAAILYT